jgi:hypothetical protein
MGEIIRMPIPELTPEQRDYWHEQAAYWGVRQEISNNSLDYANKMRHEALVMLGMVSIASVVELQQIESTEQ